MRDARCAMTCIYSSLYLKPTGSQVEAKEKARYVTGTGGQYGWIGSEGSTGYKGYFIP